SGALPSEDVFIAAIEGFGFAFVHDFDPAGFGIENMGAILKIVSDQQIDVTVAVEVRLNCAIGEPALAGVFVLRSGVSGERRRTVCNSREIRGARQRRRYGGRDEFGGSVTVARKLSALSPSPAPIGWERGTAQEQNWRAAPIIDQHVREAIFVEITGQSAHR